MASNITLTSSMRSNLSSLKSLASQMSTTQTRLSTGKKVNSAIDNASSYYQARALTNRSSDLDMLLDAMGQSIQTITAAVNGLEKSGEMLEQAAVIAQEAYEAAIIPEKSYFEELVGANGAVVTTAQELRDAINANKSTICVYGQIDMENTGITLHDNQKLVGTEYFTGYTGNKKFSQINNFRSIATYADCLISDLSVSKVTGSYGIDVNSTTTLCNLDYDFTTENHSYFTSPIIIRSSVVNLSGNININSHIVNTDGYGCVYIYQGSTFNIEDGAKVNFNSNKDLGGTNMGNNKFIVGKADFNMNNKSLWIGGSNMVSIAEGATITTSRGSFVSNGFHRENTTMNLDYSTLRSLSEFESIAPVEWDTPKEPEDLTQSNSQYTAVMDAFDDVVSDSSYQGVNLLTGGAMNVMFNETRTNSLTVQGADMRTSGLGITTRGWQTKGDIADSINEIKAAMGKIRDEVERLGNNLSIIETRMNFTDAMSDILQTGADDLVLADMNEESANYLALQTRNNLAVNALSLAAQSNNSVLKLF